MYRCILRGSLILEAYNVPFNFVRAGHNSVAREQKHVSISVRYSHQNLLVIPSDLRRGHVKILKRLSLSLSAEF